MNIDANFVVFCCALLFAQHCHMAVDATPASHCSKPSITTASGHAAPAGQLCADQLIFEENFDELNANTWQTETNIWGGGNGEFQWYTESERNAFVKDGKLFIQPTLTTDVLPDLTDCHIVIAAEKCSRGCERNCTVDTIAPPVQSARLTSSGGFAFKYGRIEIRAKLPTGDWLWPALWMQPQLNKYGTWPLSGEIDIMEARGNPKYVANGQQIGVEQFASTLHYGTEWWNSAWATAHMSYNTPTDEGLNVAFHRYQLEWTPEHLRFGIDDKHIGTISTDNGFFKRGGFSGKNPWEGGDANAPFDAEFFFIFNVAVGGTNGFFPEEGNVGGTKPWRNDAPHPARDFWNGREQWLSKWSFDANSPLGTALQIDYVKVRAL